MMLKQIANGIKDEGISNGFTKIVLVRINCSAKLVTKYKLGK